MLSKQSKILLTLGLVLFALMNNANCQVVQSFLDRDNFSKYRNLEFPAKDQFLGTSPQGGSPRIVIFNPDVQPWCKKECLAYNENGKQGYPCGSTRVKSCCNGEQNCVQKGQVTSCQDKIKEFFCYF
ncbi:hypothetical protein TTHERM_00338350 (macronuclear) [Tetrahymena thermophila SB210]|uniref:Transmembrane protein n=1 Tax=Tetrahymena thermophila (strain SB210) TaxID=312017 RepID=I7LV74_TETTS|nr:hypothetical protein TTHERM_00338350 [Tetrahymena thermophila SB210]EAR97354.2 hypothetical protein TTHERM_00338350 [Tetrahymena thermophila SB210]|eukprot:XP_001017599.2 hypothetical protein TTHERM_00338350 [Tetrahymena thermophila SB210]